MNLLPSVIAYCKERSCQIMSAPETYPPDIQKALLRELNLVSTLCDGLNYQEPFFEQLAHRFALPAKQQ